MSAANLLPRRTEASDGTGDVGILLVDDRPENLLAVEAALGGLGSRIVKAASGQEALRHLLREDFALILLDVNMPRMGGFETAALIRSRRRSADTPIIFITAYADDIHVSQGYSLGAVDYILSPVVPEVLRSKVSVFVDLYRKKAQITRQAMMLGDRAARERRLTEASLALHSTESVDDLLSLAASTASDLVASRAASAVSIADIRGGALRGSLLVDGRIGPRGSHRAIAHGDAGGLHEMARRVVDSNEILLAPQAEVSLECFESGDPPPDDAPAVTGWLGVPLRRRDGSNMGLIEVAGPRNGELDQEDQSVLVQLAQMTSIAVENCLLAEEREANQLKDEFLATLSHELRTPLTSILGWVHLLSAMEAADTPQISEALEVIERSVRAQNRLIEDLLDVSRIARGNVRLDRRPLNVCELLQRALDAARPTAAGKNLTLSLDEHGGAAWMLGDADRIQQIFGNLLSNAIKFTPPNGAVRARVIAEEGRVKVSIVDTGEGIPVEFLSRVFHRFQQADQGSTRRFSGLGIGLTIVKHLVEAHGGTIGLHSAGRGQGTTAHVEFDLLEREEEHGPEPRQTPPRADVQSPDLAGLRVLLVDDEPDARDVAARILRRSGADVVNASSAAEALSLLTHTRPDLLISDLAMPDESGFSLIAQVRKLPQPLGDIPAIALSALVGPHDSAEALSAGFQVYAAKPCEANHLLRLAAHLTNGRRG